MTDLAETRRELAAELRRQAVAFGALRDRAAALAVRHANRTHYAPIMEARARALGMAVDVLNRRADEYEVSARRTFTSADYVPAGWLGEAPEEDHGD